MAGISLGGDQRVRGREVQSSPRRAHSRRVAETFISLDTCVICRREGRGFGYCKDFFDKEFPDYTFCGMLCQDVGKAIADQHGGFIPVERLTDMEQIAIKDARQQLYDALVRSGVAPAFNDLTAAAIDDIISSVWVGLQASMHRQSAKPDAIPF